jgi:hypothetical protein
VRESRVPWRRVPWGDRENEDGRGCACVCMCGGVGTLQSKVMWHICSHAGRRIVLHNGRGLPVSHLHCQREKGYDLAPADPPYEQ